MTGAGWVAASVLTLAAVVILLPARTAQARWRHLIRTSTPLSGMVDPTAAGRAATDTASAGPTANDGNPAGMRVITVLMAVAMRRPWPTSAVIGAGAGLVGAGLAGPVAAAVFGVYAACGALLGLRWLRTRAEAISHRSAVEAVVGLAAELRAGLPVGVALANVAPALQGPTVTGVDATSVAHRVSAAVALAERVGAPVADTLDRLDSHLRAVQRARAAAAAQAAGARASASLLAAMPVAGVGLGYLVGTDPQLVLLHTPLGAACLSGAVMLQLAGLAWSARLSRMEVPA